MKSSTNGKSRARRSTALEGDGPNWVLIAGGALLSTLSVRLGYKLKQVLDAKQQQNTGNTSKGNDEPAERRKARSCRSQSSSYCFNQDNENCHVLTETELELPLVTVPSLEFSKENGRAWSSSTDRVELPQKPFHHSNSSDSPCVSESGSDIFSKREVIQKLRQQLKRRDEMILEMQDQLVELKSSLRAQVSHSTDLQSLLDVANRDLFDSEREMQRLRKVIADHCVGQVDQPPFDNGYTNGHFEAERHLKFSGRIEMLKREVAELKEIIDGKEYLLHSYKDEKVELSTQIKELQRRLDSQLPNIL